MLKLLIASLDVTALITKHQDAAVVDVKDPLPVEVEVVEVLAPQGVVLPHSAVARVHAAVNPLGGRDKFDAGVVVLERRLDSATVVRVGGVPDELHVLLRHRLLIEGERRETLVAIQIYAVAQILPSRN